MNVSVQHMGTTIPEDVLKDLHGIKEEMIIVPTDGKLTTKLQYPLEELILFPIAKFFVLNAIKRPARTVDIDLMRRAVSPFASYF